jgi:hypothetical protein
MKQIHPRQPIHARVQEAVAANRLRRNAEKLALDYVELSGELAAAVEWCIENRWERLAEHPQQLAYAQKVLAAARQRRGED